MGGGILSLYLQRKHETEFRFPSSEIYTSHIPEAKEAGAAIEKPVLSWQLPKAPVRVSRVSEAVGTLVFHQMLPLPC